jgi:paraquat-inducible protein A
VYTQLVCCEQCDAVYKRVPLKAGNKAYCSNCGATLYKTSRPLEQLLPLVIASLIFFAISNAFPIIKIDLQGNLADTTLLGAVNAMFQTGRSPVGVLVLLTAFLFPLLELLSLLYVCFPLAVFGTRPLGMTYALRLIRELRVWGMTEVFLISVLVALVKLAASVVVIPGIALWSFGALTILLVMVTSVQVTDLWDEVERIDPQ